MPSTRDLLRTAIKRSGKTQADFAKHELGVSRRTILRMLDKDDPRGITEAERLTIKLTLLKYGK